MGSPNLNLMLNFLIKNNPQIQNNPMAQSMLSIIQNGDSMQGEQIANNLCKTYGVTREQAVKQAENWLQGLMSRR